MSCRRAELEILEYKPLCIQLGFVKKIEMDLVLKIEKNHYIYKVSKLNLNKYQ